MLLLVLKVVVVERVVLNDVVNEVVVLDSRLLTLYRA